MAQSFLVIGLGRFGAALAQSLYELGQEVVCIDESEEAVHRVADHVTHAMQGNATDEAVLRAVGARNFDCVVVSMAGDIESSILITLMLREMGAKKIISKSQSALHTKVLQKIGADEVVYPEYESGMRLAQMLSSPNFADLFELSPDYSVAEVLAPKKWVGKTFAQLDMRRRHGLNILAVRDRRRLGLKVSPSADYVIQEGDYLVALGHNKDIGRLGE